MKLECKGIRELEAVLRRKGNLNLEAVKILSVNNMVARAKDQGHDPGQGGTPYDKGELLQSVFPNLPDEMGYLKDYAPHVEYGHRTLDGGFVEGQFFLRRNVELQGPIYKQDLLDEIKR